MKQEDYRRAEDGTLLVRKVEDVRMGHLPVSLGVREIWFPCLEVDADRHYLLMVLGGWFGLHKFQEKRYFYGMFYLLTCGCFGVFYLLDLVEMLCGNYRVVRVSYGMEKGVLERKRKRFYYAPVKEKRRAVFLLGFAFFLTVVLVQFLYRPVGTMVIGTVAEIIAKSVSEGELLGFLSFMR